ncbi:MAG TPA: hypothetical protein VFN09_11415 [Rhodanobacteraceae bacterium]|nr:hypothetical protein [Rhodanobacteraceae bacterium]
MHPPLALDASRMYGFWVGGDIDAMQASIDATVNVAAAGRMRFAVVTRHVLLTFTAVGKAYSTDPVDRAKGWGRETDIVTWALVARFDQGKRVPSGFYACPLHIFVDDCMALINGRELFGYPKYECQYQMPDAGAPASRFALAAKGFQPFSPDSQLTLHPLLEVTSVGGLELGERFGEVEHWRREMLAQVDADGDFWALDPDWRDDFAAAFSFPALNQLFLKQFPDASGQRAVYQAVVAAPAKVKAIRSLVLLGGDYQLELHPFASFPFDQTLGWRLGPQAARVGFQLDFDFEVGTGEVLVDNSAVAGGAVA